MLAAILLQIGAGCPRAAAEPKIFNLTSQTTKLALTVYAAGLFPIFGEYPGVSGTLEVDPDKPGFCHVSITVDQSSLAMSDPARARRALAPDMLDAADFPTMHFDGDCEGDTTAGKLTLHGVTHPLALTMHHADGLVTGEGRLLRRDYAIDGMPHLLGQLIKIHFSTTLPML